MSVGCVVCVCEVCKCESCDFCGCTPAEAVWWLIFGAIIKRKKRMDQKFGIIVRCFLFQGNIGNLR